MGDPTCKNCGISLVWAKPYVQGNPPVNPDGTKHTCDAPKGLAERKTGAPRVEVPIEQIVAEIIAIQGTIVAKNDAGETKETNVWSAEMVEGIWKFAISRKMGGRN